MGLDVIVRSTDYAARVGSYGWFHHFRTTVCEHLEGGEWGSRFPLLMNHSDCDGTYSWRQAYALQEELETIREELSAVECPDYLGILVLDDKGETVVYLMADDGRVPFGDEWTIGVEDAEIAAVNTKTGETKRFKELRRDGERITAVARNGAPMPIEDDGLQEALSSLIGKAKSARVGPLKASEVFKTVLDALLGACEAAINARETIVYC
jgi:hypothetical protein